MTAKTIEKKVNNLSLEVANLRSLIISIIQEDKDSEGEYRPKFVREVLKAMREPAMRVFKGKKDFLKQLRSIK